VRPEDFRKPQKEHGLAADRKDDMRLEKALPLRRRIAAVPDEKYGIVRQYEWHRSVVPEDGHRLGRKHFRGQKSQTPHAA
jgi:hypothetical protein